MLVAIDAGERADEPEALWALADALCVACGGHAGDAETMARVVDHCARRGVAVGAHPAYPDRAGLGRRSWAGQLAAADVEAAVAEQCAALGAIARARGVAVAWLKPHGALYHDAAALPDLARAVVSGAAAGLGAGPRTVIGPGRAAAPGAGWALREAAAARGWAYAREGFADRGHRAGGGLIPRGEAGAVLDDPDAAAAQARWLARSGEVEVVCVHADTPAALAIAAAVRAALR